MKPKYFYIKDLAQFDYYEGPHIVLQMMMFSMKITENEHNHSYCFTRPYGEYIYLEGYNWMHRWLKPVTKKNFYTIARECRNEIQELHTIAADLGLEYPEKIEVSDGSPLYDTGIHSMECVR